jgi:hypothetical protein
MGRLHHGLVEADHRRSADPARPVHANLAVAFDRRPHRRPRHPEPAGDRRRCPLDRRHPVCRPPTGTLRQHRSWSGQVGPLGPGRHLAVTVRTRPDPLPPAHPHRSARCRRIPQRDPPTILRPSSRPALTTADHRRRRLHRHDDLIAVLVHGQHREPRRAKPDRTTTVNHRGASLSRTVKQPRGSWGSPSQRSHHVRHPRWRPPVPMRRPIRARRWDRRC